MGRLNVSVMRYLQKEHFRVLTAVEMGMKNHELVPVELIAAVAGIYRGAVVRMLHELAKQEAVAHERGKRYDGYRLTNLGYDILALRALSSRKIVGAIGNQIGVGKESVVYIGGDPDLNDLVLKFHRLGRTSFRRLKEKRDYHKNRKACSWLYLSRLAATKEYAFLKALYEHKFCVPRPIDISRHLVVMEFINGKTLCDVAHLSDVESVYNTLIRTIARLARYGLIHGDFNEFNILLNEDEKPIMIDLPQMVSIDHPNAKYYFERDVDCIRNFFKKRFGFSSDLYPQFEEIEKQYNLDVEVAASGFTQHSAKELELMRNELTMGQESESSESSASSEDESECIDDSADDRLKNWIESAREELKKLDFKEELSYNVAVNAADSNEKIVQRTQVKEIESEKLPHDIMEKESADDEKKLEIKKVNGGGKAEMISCASKHPSVVGIRSAVSIGSTIAPEIVRKRVAKEHNLKQRRRLRVKGKADAVNRQKNMNADIIREYSGWEF